jgi:aminoglycoside phosphotransferase (APT) family kinase protein
VLKQQPAGSGPDIRRIAAAVARVREAGYPTPAWLASGTTTTGTSYWVQAHVPGRPATPLTTSTAELLVEVLEGQAGLDPVPDQDWGNRVAAMALSDEAGWPRGKMRDLGSAGDALLASYDRLLADAGHVCLPARDMVHGDFNSCNILLRADGVAGVIDVQGEAVAGWAALALCVAAAAFFIVEFKLRHEPAAVATVLARLHRLADDLASPGAHSPR